MRQEKSKIIVYFGKEKNSTDPFSGFGAKRKVYYELFDCGSRNGLEMYISSGRSAYKGGLFFENLLKFENGKFVEYPGVIEANAVYDRSGGLAFPNEGISSKVLNNIEFKKLCADKMKTYDFIGEFMPESISVCNKQELQSALERFDDDELVVLKPINDFGGKGIVVGSPKDVRKTNLETNVAYKLQRFVETSGGIEGIVDGRHDLRIIIVNGDVIMAHVRKPKDGGYLANVAQGGSIKEVSLDKVAKAIMDVVTMIKKKIDACFDNPIYSIDFGVMDGRPYVFELNDQIGFPREDMENAEKFVEMLVNSLVIRAQRQ